MKRSASQTNEVDVLTRVVAETVPGIVAYLTATGTRRLCREAVAMMERPLLAHVLALTGGNQIRAARVLGINRNTLRKRCRELSIEPHLVAPASAAPASEGAGRRQVPMSG